MLSSSSSRLGRVGCQPPAHEPPDLTTRSSGGPASAVRQIPQPSATRPARCGRSFPSHSRTSWHPYPPRRHRVELSHPHWKIRPMQRLGAATMINNCSTKIRANWAGGSAALHNLGCSWARNPPVPIVIGTSVGSARGAVARLLPLRFPGPPAEPAVRLSPQRALHEWLPPPTGLWLVSTGSGCGSRGSGTERP